MREMWKKHRKGFIISLAFAITMIVASAAMAQRPTLYWGSSGPEVTELQQTLSNWGYYYGSIDGSYGGGTYDAVVNFQLNNGLDADGVVGPATWSALGVSGATPVAEAYTPSTGVSSSDDVYLLAELIMGEAGEEPYLGKVAVGAVMLNRVASGSFPNSLSGVIFEPDAFESVTNGFAFSRSPTDEAMRAAQEALSGWDPTYGALFFWNPYKPVSGWIWTRQIVTQIGDHVFAL